MLVTTLLCPVFASAAEGKVVLGPAVEFSVAGGPLYKVTYEYVFPTRDYVFIDGVGKMPARGRLSYLHSGNAIRFLDQPGGTLLHSAAIKDPVRLMGQTDVPELPRESDFSRAYRQGRWAGKRPFPEMALPVLDRFFPNGYHAYAQAERQRYLTMFATLPAAPERIRAQVAVLVSASALADPHDLTFTVQFSARERRSHSEWRKELTDTTEVAVQTFISELLAALEGKAAR